MANPFCHSSQTDRLHVRWFDEVGKERRLGNILLPLCVSLFSDWPTNPGEVFRFSLPYYQIYLLTRWCFWSRDVDINCRICIHERLVLVGWHKVELIL